MGWHLPCRLKRVVCANARAGDHKGYFGVQAKVPTGHWPQLCPSTQAGRG